MAHRKAAIARLHPLLQRMAAKDLTFPILVVRSVPRSMMHPSFQFASSLVALAAGIDEPSLGAERTDLEQRLF